MVRVTTPAHPPHLASEEERVARQAPDRRTALRSGVALAAGTLTAGTLATGCSTAGAVAHPATPPRTTPPAASASPLTPTPHRFPTHPAEITHGPRTHPQVALTFHGQGDPAIAKTLLGEAEQAGARVTVLTVGTWLDEHPDMARRILDGGHDLGNHTLRHLDINAMPEAEADAEIRGCAERLKRLTGSIGTWFRPSRTPRASPLVERLARNAGYPHTLSYDVDSLDFTSPGAPAITRKIIGEIRNGSVVSLHFGYADTVAALPAVLEELHRRGLHAVTTTELLS
ncbi:polysaccharide deacetylase family protein [Streptomyces sp. NPDC001530]|uniref:polysaccharide deacetylase family protein n=1 Tax=Streptomyces sp. NPDC001530 TaxID=3364582 RepID=UPI0036CB6A66